MDGFVLLLCDKALGKNYLGKIWVCQNRVGLSFCRIVNNSKNLSGALAKAQLDSLSEDEKPISFSQWAKVLEQEPWEELLKTRRRLAIMRFLKNCGKERRQASIGLIKEFLSEWERQGNLFPETKEALR